MSTGTNNEKAKAKEEMVKSVRDLLSLKITLPLGNPNLKLVHTNQFLFTELPEDVFELTNMGVISTALNSIFSRFSGYEVNRWYIEGVTIRNKASGEATMELELNPFASDVVSYRDDKKSFETAYTDAENQATKSTSNKTTSVKSTTKKKYTTQEALDIVGKMMEKKKYKRGTFSDYKNFVKYGYGDCWAGSYFISCELEKRGVTTRIIQYGTAYSDVHRSVQYKDDNGKWQNFPYRKYKISSMFYNTKSSGTVIKKRC